MPEITHKENEMVNYRGIQKIFNFPPDERIDEQKISGIKKSTLFNFAGALIDSYINERNDDLRLCKKYLDGFNSVIDDFVEENEDVIKFFNLNVFIFLKDFFNFYIGRKEKDKLTYQNYISIAKNNYYAELINLLDEYKYLNQNELAKKANKSPQNLSNMLARVKDMGVISSFKDASDKRVTYYYLSHDFVNFLRKNSKILYWTDEYSMKLPNRPVILAEVSIDEYTFRPRSAQEYMNFDETNSYKLRRKQTIK